MADGETCVPAILPVRRLSLRAVLAVAVAGLVACTPEVDDRSGSETNIESEFVLASGENDLVEWLIQAVVSVSDSEREQCLEYQLDGGPFTGTCPSREAGQNAVFTTVPIPGGLLIFGATSPDVAVVEIETSVGRDDVVPTEVTGWADRAFGIGLDAPVELVTIRALNDQGEIVEEWSPGDTTAPPEVGPPTTAPP